VPKPAVLLEHRLIDDVGAVLHGGHRGLDRLPRSLRAVPRRDGDDVQALRQQGRKVAPLVLESFAGSQAIVAGRVLRERHAPSGDLALQPGQPRARDV
jgi:hypothetical protein